MFLCDFMGSIINLLSFIAAIVALVVSIIAIWLQCEGNKQLNKVEKNTHRIEESTAVLERIHRRLLFESEKIRLIDFPSRLVDFSKTNMASSFIGKMALFRSAIIHIFHRKSSIVEAHKEKNHIGSIKIKFEKEDTTPNSLPKMIYPENNKEQFPYFLVSFDKLVFTKLETNLISTFEQGEKCYLIAPIHSFTGVFINEIYWTLQSVKDKNKKIQITIGTKSVDK